MILLGGIDAGLLAVSAVAAVLLALGFLGLAHALLEGLLAGARRRGTRPSPRSARAVALLAGARGVALVALTVAAYALPGSGLVEGADGRRRVSRPPHRRAARQATEVRRSRSSRRRWREACLDELDRGGRFCGAYAAGDGRRAALERALRPRLDDPAPQRRARAAARPALDRRPAPGRRLGRARGPRPRRPRLRGPRPAAPAASTTPPRPRAGPCR